MIARFTALALLAVACVAAPSRQNSTYLRAVAETAEPRPSQVVSSLVQFPDDKPLTVVTWTSAADALRYRDVAPEDTWVTVEPYLRDFCREFARKHTSEKALTQRLDQRLGLPPASGDTVFLRLRIEHPSQRTIFRPCSDPSTNMVHCQAAPPSRDTDPAYAAWFYRQYYSSHASPPAELYPWTGLGYTFDWAKKKDGGFVRAGESEFVVPEGAPVEVLGSITTAGYCK